MAIQTRLTQTGWGGRPYAGFIAKAAAITGRQNITRLTQTGWGGRPYAAFVAKTAAVAVGPPKHEGLMVNIGRFLK
ncbi:MAG: hypothetical protein IIC73_03200 [Armatimonadetes bacterium]|nr:hypothetical protein [Armatimonadota bacterium]